MITVGIDMVKVAGVLNIVDVLPLLPGVIKDAAVQDLDEHLNDERKGIGVNNDLRKVDAILVTFIVIVVFLQERGALRFCPAAGELENDEAEVGEDLEGDKERVEVVNHHAVLTGVWLANYDQWDYGKQERKAE